jgi:N-acetylmuramoyl-L-alanine amidase
MSAPPAIDPPAAPGRPLLVPGAALLLLAVVAAAYCLLPLPGAFDPRKEEVAVEVVYPELARFSGQRSRAEIEAALRVVDPHRLLRPFITLQEGQLEIRRRANDSAPAVRIALRPPGQPAPASSIRWNRIALDPGHAGGTFARPEQRIFRAPGGGELREGDLNWVTAGLLAAQLRAAGLEVQLLRPPPPQAPFDPGAVAGFDPVAEGGQWLAENHQTPVSWLSPRMALALREEGRREVSDRPFELYTRFELRRRAAAAVAFDAGITLSLHHNFTTTGTNGVLVFVPGDLLPDELRTESQRYWALLRLLDGAQPATLALASAMGRALMREMTLPPSPEGDPTWLPVDTAAGVYARNLAMLRRAPGAALVLEGPPVNHPDEYPGLLAEMTGAGSLPRGPRLQQYARAVAGVLRERAATAGTN